VAGGRSPAAPPAGPGQGQEQLPPAQGSRPEDPAGPPAPPLRDAGIRSVTPVAEAAPVAPAWEVAPAREVAAAPDAGRPAEADAPVAGGRPAGAAAADHRPAGQDRPGVPPDELLAERWRDLGRRLLATHLPAPPDEPADAFPPGVGLAGPAPPPPAPAAPPADGQGPTLVIEQLEVRLLPAPPPDGPAPPGRPAGNGPPRPAWDAAARHYLGKV
jgi:hypothetical protein